jgi:1,2-diacylglycerol-3-alpha-glucose alpha-1,2-glucosyltransferase
MKVCLYLEFGEVPTVRKSGFWTAFQTQRRQLEKLGVQVVKDPTADDYELLHLHSYGPRSFYYLKRAKRRGKVVVVHAHSVGSYDLKDGFVLTTQIAPLYERYLHHYYRGADCLFTPSERAKELLREKGLPEPIEVVHNSVDAGSLCFSPDKREGNRRALSLERFTVIAAGNLIPRKGVVDFIQAGRTLPQFDFVWYGQQWGFLAFHPRMDREIRRRPGNVQMPGFVDDMQAALSGADAFFFPSYGETGSIVLLEAAACGLPLIVRDLPEYRGWLEHEENCLKGTSRREFAELLERVAGDRVLRERLSQNARRTAEAYSVDRVGNRLMELYTALLAGRAKETAASVSRSRPTA